MTTAPPRTGDQVSLGEYLFRQLRTHEIAREPNEDLWLALPQRRRDEYEAAAEELHAEAQRREP